MARAASSCSLSLVFFHRGVCVRESVTLLIWCIYFVQPSEMPTVYKPAVSFVFSPTSTSVQSSIFSCQQFIHGLPRLESHFRTEWTAEGVCVNWGRPACLQWLWHHAVFTKDIGQKSVSISHFKDCVYLLHVKFYEVGQPLHSSGLSL